MVFHILTDFFSLGGSLLTFSAPYLRYGLIESVLAAWATAIFFRNITPTKALTYALAQKNSDTMLGLHTEMYIYAPVSIRRVWRYHHALYQPYGMKPIDEYQSSLFQCGACGALNSWKPHIHAQKMFITWICQSPLQNPFDGDVNILLHHCICLSTHSSFSWRKAICLSTSTTSLLVFN